MSAPTKNFTQHPELRPLAGPKFTAAIDWLPTAALYPNPRNARTHSKKQIRQIAASIRAFGFLNPILIDHGGMIIAGHGRWEAAKIEGMKDVPTIVIDHMTDAQKRAYVLADNKIALEAGWSQELLAIELAELSDLMPLDNMDISVTGFAAPEIDLIISNMAEAKHGPEDVVPAPPSEPSSRPGDLWLLGKHRLLCGDARDAVSVARLMNGANAACVFTDPPYNVRIRSIVGRGKIKHAEFAFGSGEMSPADFRSFLSETLSHAAGHSKDGAIIYVFIDWRHVDVLIEVARTIFGAMLNLVVWNKTNAGQGSFYRSQHELIGVFRAGVASHQNNIELGKFGRNRSNVWTYPGVNTFGRGRLNDLSVHPTVKPVALVADALLDCTTKGDVVLDPFMGSGTTILAAEKVGRRAYGLEFEPRYVDVAIQRWEAMTKLEAVLDGDGRTFSEISAARLTSGSPDKTNAGVDPFEYGDWTALWDVEDASYHAEAGR